uniref:F-box domain-containing protein n=1 Tax=Caenorhabditis tropicalis TaxID=1561998 RepID=A0A1I7T210_9PELO
MHQSSSNDGYWSNVFSNPLLMESIVKRLSFLDIHRLRKVCRGARECMEIIKPDPQIYSVFIKRMNLDQFDVEFNLKYGFLRVSYISDDSECFVSSGEKTTKVSSNFLETLISDMASILKHQKAALKGIKFEMSLKVLSNQICFSNEEPPDLIRNEFFDAFKQTFFSEKTWIPVERVTIETSDQQDVLDVLSSLNPAHLRDVELWSAYQRYEKTHIDLEEVSNLKQWKKAKRLLAKRNLIIDTPVQKLNLSHFRDIKICVDSISPEEILNLKQICLESRAFKRFIFELKNPVSESSLHNSLGAPIIREDDSSQKKEWVFRTSSSSEMIFSIDYLPEKISFYNLPWSMFGQFYVNVDIPVID